MVKTYTLITKTFYKNIKKSSFVQTGGRKFRKNLNFFVDSFIIFLSFWQEHFKEFRNIKSYSSDYNKKEKCL
jgi:hypothetical protein